MIKAQYTPETAAERDKLREINKMLLEALEELLEHAERWLDFGGVGGKEKDIQQQARAAIAKARGE